MDDCNQGTNIKALFFNFQKRSGRPPSPTPSSYASAKYGSDNYKTVPNIFLRFHIRVIPHWLIF